MENVISLNKPFTIKDTTNKKYVLIDENQYNEFLIAQEELSILKSIARGEEDIEKGNVFTHEEIKQILGVKWN